MSSVLMTPDQQQLVLELEACGGLQFGKFTLKSGVVSPIYINLRVLIAYPKLMKRVAKEYAKLLSPLTYDLLAGVAYAALPIAGAVSIELEQPWIYARKERKGYGTDKLIEGNYQAGDTVVVIDDMITDGASKFEAIEVFEKESLKIKDIVVLIDREQGGGEALRAKSYHLHSMIAIGDAVDVLEDVGKISSATATQVRDFFAQQGTGNV